MKNNGSLKYSNCETAADPSEDCRTMIVPTETVRDGYLEDFPVLTYQLTLFDKGNSSAVFVGKINITCSDVIRII